MASIENSLSARLADLGEFRNGVNFGKGMKGSGLGLINVKDIFCDSPKVDFESLDLVNLADSRGVERYFVEAGDLFFVRSSVKRDGIGFVAYSDRKNHDAVHCGFVIRFRPDKHKVDSRFLTYALRSPNTRERIRNLSGGAAITNISQEALRTLELDIPPLPEQRRIAGILSAYDELMENSQRRIRLLEAMARALYREWFVHFRFPGHEKHPRVASPLGDIPQGWEVLPISTIANIVLGGTPSRSINEYWYGGTIPWLKSGKLNDLRVIEGSELITARGFEMSATKLMPPKTVLVAITGAILISFLEIEACANQSVIGIYETKKVCPEYLHIYLSENISLFESKMSGSAQQHINKDIVEQTLVLVPHEKPGYAFRLFVQPLYEEIALLLFKIQNLRRTRDLLLPRLLSGQVHQIKTEP